MHTSLRDDLETNEDLYAVLQREHIHERRGLRRWSIGALTGVVAVALVPWPWVALPAGVAAWAIGRWVLLLVDHVARHWFMHHVSLMDLLHPSDDTGLELVRLGFEELMKQDQAMRKEGTLKSFSCPGCPAPEARAKSQYH